MNKHLIEIRYIPATGTKPARISLTSHWDGSRMIVPSIGWTNTIEVGVAMLSSRKFTVEARGIMKRGFFILVNEFKPLKQN